MLLVVVVVVLVLVVVYEKPQMKKVYSPEHDRLHPFKTIASSCSCAACSSCGGACTGCGI